VRGNKTQKPTKTDIFIACPRIPTSIKTIVISKDEVDISSHADITI
jgi:hypothetical protein